VASTAELAPQAAGPPAVLPTPCSFSVPTPLSADVIVARLSSSLRDKVLAMSASLIRAGVQPDLAQGACTS